MSEFNGKTVLITGGGSGIGLATAQLLVTSGANVVLAGRDRERLGQAAKQIDADDKVLTVATDVTRPDDIARLMGEAQRSFGGLDGLFCNAGTGVLARCADVTEEVFDHVVGTNFRGVYFTVQQALPVLNDGASVVLTSSWTVQRGLALGSLYSASKAAVRSLAGSLASDLADRGIRVNSVTPGHIQTAMLDGITGGVSEVREVFRSQVTAGRFGDPGEVAETVAFLLSSRASYVSGQDIVVDGGLLGSVPFNPLAG